MKKLLLFGILISSIMSQLNVYSQDPRLDKEMQEASAIFEAASQAPSESSDSTGGAIGEEEIPSKARRMNKY